MTKITRFKTLKILRTIILFIVFKSSTLKEKFEYFTSFKNGVLFLYLSYVKSLSRPTNIKFIHIIYKIFSQTLYFKNMIQSSLSLFVLRFLFNLLNKRLKFLENVKKTVDIQIKASYVLGDTFDIVRFINYNDGVLKIDFVIITDSRIN